MMNTTVRTVAKHSLLYSYVLSQPFATYVDIYPFIENKILMNADQLSYGEQGKSVRVLQEKLYEQAYYIGESDGFFGVVTESAVKQFQERHELQKTGEMDKVTVDQLLEMEKERYIRNIEELGTSIFPGMHHEDVEIVQKALSYFGYYEGNVDGIYGPLTLQALEIAEDAHDLELVSDVSIESLKEIYEDVEEQQKVEVAMQTKEEGKIQEKDEDKKERTKEKTVSKQVETTPNNGSIVNIAHDYIGTPYVWGGTSPSGFDCSGFLNFVFEQDNQTIPRTVNEIWNFSTPVDHPSVGDIVFFETYQAGASHAGIYIGDQKFIHAGESRGVEISNLEQEYWKERYIGAHRIE